LAEIFRVLKGRLSEPDLDEQVGAVEDLGDVLEYADWTEEQVRPILNGLVARLPTSNRDLDEAILSDLLKAMARDLPLEVDLEPLANRLGQLPPPLLSYGLEALGWSGKEQYRQLLVGYLEHESEEARQAASDAVKELDWAQSAPFFDLVARLVGLASLQQHAIEKVLGRQLQPDPTAHNPTWTQLVCTAGPSDPFRRAHLWLSHASGGRRLRIEAVTRAREAMLLRRIDPLLAAPFLWGGPGPLPSPPPQGQASASYDEAVRQWQQRRTLTGQTTSAGKLIVGLDGGYVVSVALHDPA